MRKNMEELIGAVKKHRALWDTSTSAYKDLSKRMQAWRIVSDEVGLTLESAKSKWRGLRDTYIKFLKSQKRTTDYGRKRRKKYCYAEQMEFMKHIIVNIKPRVPREREASFDVWEEPNEETLLPPEDEQQDETECSPHKGFREANNSKNEAFEILWKNPNTEGEMDATDMLFLSYAKTVKTFSKRRQILLKRKLAEVFSDAELEQMTEDEVEFISPSFIGTLAEPMSNGCKNEPT